jgi:hypothetical protein
MKLYSEEQVQEAYNRGHMDGRLNNTDYSITDGFEPIELPSDEEIVESSEKGYVKIDGNRILNWINGAKWMKEQIILNQNK